MDERWFEYDWRFEGEDCVCGVEMKHAVDDAARMNYSVLIIIEGMAKKDIITDSQWRKLEILRSKVIKHFDVLYAGFIKMASTVRYYFYTTSKNTATSIEVKFAKNAGFSCDYVDDPNWKYYFKLLYPTKAKLQTEENFKTIETYKKMGDCLTATRRITLHMSFPSESLRMLFEEQARLAGFAIGNSEFNIEYDMPHGIMLHKITTLLKRDIDAITTEALSVAEKYDGTLTYWDSVSVPDRRLR